MMRVAGSRYDGQIGMADAGAANDVFRVSGLVSGKTGEERVYRIVENDVSSKRKGRPGRKAA
ncbi:MAG: hypothetical protein WA624_18735 [Methylocella sp.]